MITYNDISDAVHTPQPQPAFLARGPHSLRTQRPIANGNVENITGNPESRRPEASTTALHARARTGSAERLPPTQPKPPGAPTEIPRPRPHARTRTHTHALHVFAHSGRPTPAPAAARCIPGRGRAHPQQRWTPSGRVRQVRQCTASDALTGHSPIALVHPRVPMAIRRAAARSPSAGLERVYARTRRTPRAAMSALSRWSRHAAPGCG